MEFVQAILRLFDDTISTAQVIQCQMRWEDVNK